MKPRARVPGTGSEPSCHYARSRPFGTKARLRALTALLTMSILMVSVGTTSCSSTNDIVKETTDGARSSSNRSAWSAVSAGAKIRPQTWLASGKSGRTKLAFESASSTADVIAANEAELQTRPDRNVLLKQCAGDIFVNEVKNKANEAIYIDKFGKLTPVGTCLHISVTGDVARIAVYEGSASFMPLVSQTGVDSILIHANEELTVPPGGTPGTLARRSFTLDEVRWFRELGASVPKVAIADGAIDFSNVAVGTSLGKAAGVNNDGNAVLSITSVARVSGSPEFTYGGPSVPFAINPGQSQQMTIRFSPLSSGSKSAVFRVSSNDPDEPTVDFSMTGRGTAPNIRALTAISFPNVTVGGPSLDGTALIYNDGNAVLSITSVARVSGSPEFTYGGPAVPFNINPGQSQQITIRFSPLSSGSKSAVFRVSSNDPDESAVVFSAYGTGVVPSIRTPINSITNFLYSLGTTTIFNDGLGILTITGVTRVSGTAELTYDSPSVPFTIGPGQSRTITIRLTATSPGLKNATFRISSSDAYHPSVDFGVSVSVVW